MFPAYLHSLYPEAWQRRIIWAAFIFSFTLILLRAFVVPLSDHQARGDIRGDWYSDQNTLSAARYFRDFGFGPSKGLPMFGYEGDGRADTAYAYTHYPALPDLVAGTAMYATQSDAVWVLRMVPILVSAFWFWLIFYMLGHMLPQPGMALAGGLLVVLSHYFLFFADTYHKHVYEELFKWLYVYALWAYFAQNRKKQLVWAALWMFLAVQSSYEPVVYLAIATLGLSWYYRGSPLRWQVWVLGAASVAGVASHVLRVYAYMGSWAALVQDYQDSLQHRTQGSGVSTMNETGGLEWWHYMKIPFEWFNRPERLFQLTGWAFLLLAIPAMLYLRRQHRALFALCLTLFVATIAWSLVLSQHYLVHLFTTRHWGLLYGVLGGVALVLYLQRLRADWLRPVLLPKVLHGLFIAYILVMAVSQQWLDWFRYGFLYILL